MANDYKDRFISRKQDEPLEKREQTNIAPDWQILSPERQAHYGILPKTLPQIAFSDEEDKRRAEHCRYLRRKAKKEKQKNEQKLQKESSLKRSYEGDEETSE